MARKIYRTSRAKRNINKSNLRRKKLKRKSTRKNLRIKNLKRKSSRKNLTRRTLRKTRNRRQNFRSGGSFGPPPITGLEVVGTHIGHPPVTLQPAITFRAISYNLLAPQYCGEGRTSDSYKEFLTRYSEREDRRAWHENRIEAQVNFMRGKASVFLCQEFSPEMYTKCLSERFECSPGCMLYVSPDGYSEGFFSEAAKNARATGESGIRFRGGRGWLDWTNGTGKVEGAVDGNNQENYVWAEDSGNSTTTGIIWESTVWTCCEEVHHSLKSDESFKASLKEYQCFENIYGYGTNSRILPGFTVATPWRNGPKSYDWKSSTIVALKHNDVDYKVVFCSIHLPGGQRNDDSAENLISDTLKSAKIIHRHYGCHEIILSGDFNRSPTKLLGLHASKPESYLGKIGALVNDTHNATPTVYNADYDDNTIQRYDWFVTYNPLTDTLTIPDVVTITGGVGDWGQNEITDVEGGYPYSNDQLLISNNLSDHLPIQSHFNTFKL